jgi:hypothetical protein
MGAFIDSRLTDALVLVLVRAAIILTLDVAPPLKTLGVDLPFLPASRRQRPNDGGGPHPSVSLSKRVGPRRILATRGPVSRCETVRSFTNPSAA